MLICAREIALTFILFNDQENSTESVRRVRVAATTEWLAE